MRKSIIYSCFLLLVLAACGKDRDNKPGELDGRWKMVSVKDKSSSQILLPPAGEDSKVYLVFAGRKFSGATSRNTYSNGNFDLTNSTELVFRHYTTTFVTETEWGGIMSSLLGYCFLQSTMPCSPSIVSRPTATLMEIDTPLRYKIILEKF